MRVFAVRAVRHWHNALPLVERRTAEVIRNWHKSAGVVFDAHADRIACAGLSLRYLLVQPPIAPLRVDVLNLDSVFVARVAEKSDEVIAVAGARAEAQDAAFVVAKSPGDGAVFFALPIQPCALNIGVGENVGRSCFDCGLVALLFVWLHENRALAFLDKMLVHAIPTLPMTANLFLFLRGVNYAIRLLLNLHAKADALRPVDIHRHFVAVCLQIWVGFPQVAGVIQQIQLIRQNIRLHRDIVHAPIRRKFFELRHECGIIAHKRLFLRCRHFDLSGFRFGWHIIGRMELLSAFCLALAVPLALLARHLALL